MTTDLDRLIEAVEGDCVNWLGWERRDDVLPGGLWAVARDADRGSLDSAVALLEALLPGRHWSLDDGGDDMDPPYAVVWTGERTWSANIGAEASNPARALLLATLRAYRSTRDGG